MLTYFPNPYPDEWWYSVLSRYHVRSLTSIRRLQNLAQWTPQYCPQCAAEDRDAYGEVNCTPRNGQAALCTGCEMPLEGVGVL